MKYLRFLLLPLWYLAMSCATQTTPQGGPKDTIPPSPVRFVPKENQTNFKGSQISIEFDEAIQLNNPKDEIIIVPSTGKKTEFKLKGNTLVIIPENDLKENTTYNINFREGVKDVTEQNAAKDLRGTLPKDVHLAFSTGDIIDTLSISGTVKNGLDEKIPEDITLALYQADTFDIFEDIPEYFTKSNKEGKFSITNLKAGTYKLYAFADKNKNLKAETRTEKFGFYSKPIQLDSMVKGLSIIMVNIDTRKPKLTSVRNQSYLNTIRFSKSMTNYKLISAPHVTSTFATNQTEILAYYPENDVDSMLVHVSAIDSVDQKIDTTVYIKRDKREKIPDQLKLTPSDPTYNLETNQLQFSILYNKPIKSINPDSIYLKYDSITVLPLKFKFLRIDTAMNKLTIDEPIPLDSLPKDLKLTIAPGYIITIENDTSKLMLPTFRLFDTETTASLIVKANTKAEHFIIQLVDGSNKVIDQVVDQKTVTFKYLTPQTYKIRAIIDTNGNGRWDTANYPKNSEPEKIIYYQNSERKYEVPLRANWTVGPINIRF